MLITQGRLHSDVPPEIILLLLYRKLSLFEWIQDVHPEMKVYSILKSAQV